MIDLKKDIQHGVYLRFGPLPQKLTWDIAFSRWGSWPHPITWQDHLAIQEKVQAREQLHRVPCFMKCKKHQRK